MAGLSEDLPEELFRLEDAADLCELLRRRPDLRDGQAARDLRAMAEMPGYGAGFAAIVELLADAGDDVERAWQRFERRRQEIAGKGEELEETVKRVEAAIEAGDYDTVAALAESAAVEAEGVGLGLPAGFLIRATASRSCDACPWIEPATWSGRSKRTSAPSR